MAGQIGEAFFKLTLIGGRDVRAEIVKIRNSVRKMGADFDGSLGRAADRMEKSTEGARKFQGAIGGVLGIITVVAAVAFKLGNGINSVSEAMRDGSEKAEEYFRTLNQANTVEAAAENFKAIQDRVDELNGLLANSSAGNFIASIELAARGGRERVEEEVEALQAKQRQQSSRLRAQREKERREENQAESDTARAARIAVELEVLKAKAAATTNEEARARLETEAANLELQEQILSITDQIRSAEDAENQQAVEDLLARRQLLVELNAIRINGIEEAKKAAMDAAKAEADERIRQAERVKEETIRANREAAQESARQAAESAAAALETSPVFTDMRDLLADITSEIQLASRRQS